MNGLSESAYFALFALGVCCALVVAIFAGLAARSALDVVAILTGAA